MIINEMNVLVLSNEAKKVVIARLPMDANMRECAISDHSVLVTDFAKRLVTLNVTAVRLPVNLVGTVNGMNTTVAVDDAVSMPAFIANGITGFMSQQEVDCYNNITKVEEEVKVNKDTEFNEEQIFEALEKAIEGAATTVANEGSREDVKRLMSAKDCDVYSALLYTLGNLKIRQLLKGKAKQSSVTDEVINNVEEATKDLQDKPTLWVKVKAFIAFVVRKTVALLRGTLAFAFDTTTILGLMVGRVVYHTAREMVYASKSIGIAFKKDIIDTVRTA